MSDSPSQEAYRVLARKYRPQTFDQLIGQDAMVRTLRNAIEAKRLAHAFIMTGVRGVGKTTTARLIARALNCVGPDGTGAETIEPCGVCEFCLAIAAGTHPDVIEMDAASNTGVDDIRTIIDNVPYAASSARYKIYIIDEVHMLSRNAFNALLKTLEEPPSHVKFIFATTEIAKVPVTVLSRCQRFDLKRVDAALLAQHFAHICEHENVEAEPAALALIAQAAEGSVRDGLSLLDQAIAHSGAHVTADQVREMIGLADNAAVLELARTVLAGDVPAAIDLFEAQYKNGADPQSVIEALLEAVHWLTKCRLYPNQAPAVHTAPEEHGKGLELASSVAIPALNTAWQILLKGLAEVKAAPRPVAAAEMVLVRLGYAATLPSPADLVKKLEHKPTSAAPAAPPQAHQKAPANEPAAVAAPVTAFKSAASTAPSPAPSAVAPPADGPVAVAESHLRLVETPQSETIEQPVDEALTAFETLVGICDDHKEGMLAFRLRAQVRVAVCDLKQHVLSFASVDQPDQTLITALRAFLSDTLDEAWAIQYVPESQAPTLEARDAARAQEQRQRALNDPAVKRALEVFPAAKVINVRSMKAPNNPADRPLPKAPDGYDVLPDAAYEPDYEAGPHPFDPDADLDF